MAPTPRSVKRRKLSSPDEGSQNVVNESPSNTGTPAKSGLRRPTRRNGLLSTTQERTSASPVVESKSTGKRNVADNSDIYDDIDGALETESRQLRSRGAAATNGAKTPAQTSKEIKDKSSRTQNGSRRRGGREGGEEDQGKSTATMEAQSTQSTGRTRRKYNEMDELADGEATPALARSRARGKKAAPAEAEDAVSAEKVPEVPSNKRKAAAAKTPRSTRRQATEDRHEQTAANELGDEAAEHEESSIRRRLAPKEVASATPKKPGVASLSDLIESENESGNETVMQTVQKTAVTPRRNNKAVITQKHQESDGVLTASNPHQGTAVLEDELTLLKTILLNRITGKRPTSLVGLEDEYNKVFQLVEQTVNAGEGNSMLIIGSRGSGKSALVRKAVSELSKEQRQDFHIIRLNGFVHTDDKLALREIWRQLGREMDVEEDTLGKNYADTLATLLALLSHPSELTGGEGSEQVAKAIVFVMDEFDLFALHPRQTLLYNLFDIAQSRKAPIAVLGLTTRIGVAESLEKRVKSRFSHRYVHLSLAKSFTAFQEICKTVLLLGPEELSVEEHARLARSADSKGVAKGKKGKQDDGDLLGQWNTSVTRLFADPTFINQHLAPHYYLSKSVPSALSSFHLPISLLNPSAPFLIPSASTPAQALTTLRPPDSKLALLPSLTDLQLSLLIAAARLDIIHDTDTCNFNMAYAEYVSLSSRAKIASTAAGALAAGAATKVWGRDVARAEWERLVGWELLVPVLAGAVGPTSMVRCDVALEEIAPSVPGLEKVMEKWCRQI